MAESQDSLQAPAPACLPPLPPTPPLRPRLYRCASLLRAAHLTAASLPVFPMA